MMLVGTQPAGTWVLGFHGAARQVLSDQEAAHALAGGRRWRRCWLVTAASTTSSPTWSAANRNFRPTFDRRTPEGIDERAARCARHGGGPAPVAVAPGRETGATVLDPATFDAWADRPGAAMVVFAEEPDRYKETLDIAVIVPELHAARAGRFRLALLPPEARARWHRATASRAGPRS